MMNQTISHYRILGRLGSGGMGVVLEAEDLALKRKVALKFLPPELLRDQTALDRFLLEARTASALNHPNICTIYAVESAVAESGEAQSFIAMELLEGQSLEQKLAAGPLPPERVLDIAIQLADALDAAHAKRIIHRDLKPANLFLTQRGTVKVLDFGLAKRTPPGMEMDTIGATEELSNSLHLTSPGATVGTIAYMSPEQARGEELDLRTDLFSLGTVIYHMATGKLPFAGATSAVIFHAILQLDPVPALQLNAAIPPRLQEIIDKLLEKDRDLRYQSAADLRGDLKRLKRDTESARRSAATSVLGSIGASADSAAQPSGATAARAPSPHESFPAPPPARRSSSWLRLAGTGVALLVAGLLAYSIFFRNRAVPFQNLSVTKLTDSGDIVFATISPDGQYLLSMRRTNGLASLWLRNVPSSSNVEVQPAADVYYNGLRFSPDGNFFYFVRSDPGNAALKYLYRAPLLGGAPQKLAADIDSNVTFSPDGKKVAFMRFNSPEAGKYRLIVRPVEGGDADERVVASGPASRALNHPAWAPDGKTIVCNESNVGGVLEVLTAVDVATGAKKTFFGSNTQLVEMPVWMPDGSGLLGVLHGMSSNFNQTQIAFVSYPGAKLSHITHDINTYTDVSIAKDGHTLSTVMSEGRWNLFVMPDPGSGAQARSLTSAEAFTNFTWTRDGLLISDQKASLNRIDPATSTKTTIATEEGSANGNPSACPDGRYIAFELAFRRGGEDDNIWRMDASGGNLKQLTSGKQDTHAVCSPDSRWVYFMQQGDEAKLARVAIDGGEAQTVANVPIIDSQIDVSPDGKLAAFATLEHSGEHKEWLALVSIDSGAVRHVDFERPLFGLVRFSPDGKGVVYATRDNGVDNLWLQPLDGSKGHAITDFNSERIYDFHWSFDGKQLAMVRGHNDTDDVLMRDLQP
ncbi:MAG TPA: protein kinase [Terriglobales bacterium]|nr:protein kinase [Terriglobales bacterium]